MLKHHLTKRAVTAALVIAAASVPAEAAQAIYRSPGGGPPVAAQLAPAQPVVTSDSSFQWGDAGIGAAGAVALLGTGVFGVSATRRRRRTVAG